MAAARLNFDFDPLHLKDPKSEGMSTLRDLMKDPMNTPYTLGAIAASPEEARAKEDKIGELPEVRMTVSALDLVPDHQDEKLDILQNLGFLMGPALSCGGNKPAPTPAEIETTRLEAANSIKAYLASAQAKEPLKSTATTLLATLDRLKAETDPARLTQMVCCMLSARETIPVTVR